MFFIITDHFFFLMASNPININKVAIYVRLYLYTITKANRQL